MPAASFRPPSPEERVRARTAIDLPEGAEVAVYVGALAEEKGVRDAVEAVAEVPGLHLLMIGQGPEREGLSALGARTAPGRVHLPGPSEDVLTAYWASDVFLFPTRGGDSMPAAVIEAGRRDMASQGGGVVRERGGRVHRRIIARWRAGRVPVSRR